MVSAGQEDQTDSDRLNLIDTCLRDSKHCLTYLSIKKPHFLVSVKTGLWRGERIGEVYAERERRMDGCRDGIRGEGGGWQIVIRLRLRLASQFGLPWRQPTQLCGIMGCRTDGQQTHAHTHIRTHGDGDKMLINTYDIAGACPCIITHSMITLA